MRDRLARLIAPYDAVLTPTVAIRPVPVGGRAHVELNPADQALYTLIRFTVLLNVTGYPGISVRLGLDFGGLPRLSPSAGWARTRSCCRSPRRSRASWGRCRRRPGTEPATPRRVARDDHRDQS